MIKQLLCAFLCATSIHHLACMDADAAQTTAACTAKAKRIAKKTNSLAHIVTSLTEQVRLLEAHVYAEKEQQANNPQLEASQSNGTLHSLLSSAQVALFESATALSSLQEDTHTIAQKLLALSSMMPASTSHENQQASYEYPTESNYESDHTDDSDDDTFVQLLNISSNHYTVLITDVHFSINITAINTVPSPENSAVSQLTRQRRNSI